LVAEHFWLVFLFGIGGVVLFILFPIIAVFLIITAIAVGLIMQNAKAR
jgi:hypothetical protein